MRQDEDRSILTRGWEAYAALPGGFHCAIIAAALASATWIFVVTDRPRTALVPLFFVPVLLAALRYYVRGALVCGVLGALLAGPVAYELAHPALTPPAGANVAHWLAYLLSLVVVGASTGGAMAYARSRTDTLRRYMYTDAATGLPNLAALRRDVLALLRQRRHGDPVVRSVTKAAVRMNNHQSLVNAFGYPFADAAVGELARRLRARVPGHFLVARVGPGTIACVAPGRAGTHVDLCRQLLAAEQQRPLEVGGIPVHANLSVGLASAEVEGFDVERLFADAETAASEADALNRKLMIHVPAERARQEDRARLLGEVGAALGSGQMRLAFQPRLNLHSGRVESLEALARWQHPDRGWLAPARFIPLVEETRLIEPFTAWVVSEAIRQLAVWRRAGFDLGVSVNVSSRNIGADDALMGLADALSSEHLPPPALELEITESAFIDINHEKLQALDALRSLGVRIAIDDFGTGYASLACLRKLPLDVLKLDRSFISDGLDQPRDRLMVRRMVELAKDRELTVVAEGVESEAILSAVAEMGCDEAQGYHIARPMFSDALDDLLRRFGRRFDGNGHQAVH